MDVIVRALQEAEQQQTKIGQFLAETGSSYMICREIGTGEIEGHTIAVCALACSRRTGNPPDGPLGVRLTIWGPDGSTEACYLDHSEVKELVTALERASASRGPFDGLRMLGAERGELRWRSLAGLKITLVGETECRNRVSHTVLELGRVRLQTPGTEALRTLRELLFSADSHIAASWANGPR